MKNGSANHLRGTWALQALQSLINCGGGGAVEIPLLVLLVAKSCPTFATPWTVALQAPLSIGFPREEYWSGLPFLSPGDLSDPGVEPMSPAFAGRSLLLSYL